MQIRNWIIAKRVDKWEVASFWYLVLFFLFSAIIALHAQSLPIAAGATGSPASVHDLAMGGTVRRLITAPAAGAPAGLELVVDGPQGSFTASLGPNLSRGLQQSLTAGTPVQISGTMQAIEGQEYLVARTLTIGGSQIVIRNEYGFFVHTPSRARAAQNNSALYRSAK